MREDETKLSVLIERAKQGIPSEMPYGRTFDEKTMTWSIVREEQLKLQWACEKYLQGASANELERILFIYDFRRLVAEFSGTEWTIVYTDSDYKIERVHFTVPRLLDQDLIEKVRAYPVPKKIYQKREELR